jgi:DNA-binding Lrp family transcriptional regulator
MDDTDREFLNIVQNDFPVAPRPYAVLADKLNLSEAEIIERVRILKEKGIIRRIGAVFDPRKLGFISVLAAAEVPEAEIDTFAAAAGDFHEITHIYVRDAEVNVWFTISAPTRDRLDEILSEIKAKTGIAVHLLSADRIYKVKVVFQF